MGNLFWTAKLLKPNLLLHGSAIVYIRYLKCMLCVHLVSDAGPANFNPYHILIMHAEVPVEMKHMSIIHIPLPELFDKLSSHNTETKNIYL